MYSMYKIINVILILFYFTKSIASQADPGIRLVNSAGEVLQGGAGIIQLLAFGQWGYICHNKAQPFTPVEYATACQQLGYESFRVPDGNLEPLNLAAVPFQFSSIVCSDLHRSKNLLQCHGTWSPSRSCLDNKAVSVHCTNKSKPNVRLVNGTTPSSGRVEVFAFGEWGTVCDHTWTALDGDVVCKQLGYAGCRSHKSGSHYGVSPLPYGLTKTKCAGTETDIFKCPSNGWKTVTTDHPCGPQNNAGVECINTTVPINLQSPSVVHLLDEAGVNTGAFGFVRIHFFSMGGYVIWKNGGPGSAMHVICRQMGYSQALNSTYLPLPPAPALRVYNFQYSDLTCSEAGSEKDITHCVSSWSLKTSSLDDLALHVHCDTAKPVMRSAYVSLYVAPNATVSNVLVRMFNEWGAICGSAWNQVASNVVCRQKGFTTAATVTVVPDSPVPLKLNLKSCVGTEENILHCNSDGWKLNQPACPANSFAAVVCQ